MYAGQSMRVAVALCAPRKPLPSSLTNDKSACLCSSSSERSPQVTKKTAS
jgi:hypothetical protein